MKKGSKILSLVEAGAKKWYMAGAVLTVASSNAFAADLSAIDTQVNGLKDALTGATAKVIVAIPIIIIGWKLLFGGDGKEAKAKMGMAMAGCILIFATQSIVSMVTPA